MHSATTYLYDTYTHTNDFYPLLCAFELGNICGQRNKARYLRKRNQ